MPTDLVSIIIPVYNGAKYLAPCIESVLAQSHQNIEIIIVDDGSDDDSLNIAKTYESERVKVFAQNKNGASSARNLGLSMSNGNYIQFLDSDDWIGSEKLKNQLLALKGEKNAIANCRTIHFYSGDDISKIQPSNYEDRFYLTTARTDEFLIKLWGGFSPYGSMISTHAWLIPKTLIDGTKGWNTKLTTDDDGEFFSRIILASKKIVYCPDVFVYYRKQHQASLSQLNSEEKLSSLLLSAKLKTDHLLKINNSEPAKLATYKVILDIAVNSYHKYPKLYKTAIKSLPSIKKPNYVPSLGGRFIQKLSKYFGWRTALTVQKYLRKI